MRWIIGLLLISNVFFICQTYIWQGEAVKQLIGTSDIEDIYRKLGKRFSYTQALELSVSAGVDIQKYRVGPLDGEYIYAQADKKGLVISNHTVLYFKDGYYWGSRVTEAPRMGPWLYRILIWH